jgi:predicted nucleic acid-binding protein
MRCSCCYLHRAGILHVLPAILGGVIVPSQVVAELSAGRARGYDLPNHRLVSHPVRTTAKLQHLSRWQWRATPWTRKGTTGPATQP